MTAKPTYEALEQRVMELEQKVHELKQTEAFLRENQNVLHAAIENLPFDFFALDENNRYFLQNSACIKHWGNLIGKCPQDIKVDEPLLNTWLDNNRRALSGKIVRGELEYIQDGEKRNFYNIISPIYDGQRIIGILGINLDITDQKRLEMALENLNEELEKRIEKRTVELMESNRQLKKKIEERNQVEDELRVKTRDLEELNTALKVLLKKRGEDKFELEEKIAGNVKDLIFPYLEKLKRVNFGNREKTFLEIVEANLAAIISPFERTLSSKFIKLTPAEIQAANLIKLGKTSKEIAALSNLSSKTIEFHRNNIRTKLGIKNKKVNLRTHLLTLE